MKSALKRVASLLMAIIMILEVVTPGVVQARSGYDNRATVSDEEFVPGDAYVPSAQNQPQRQAPSSYRPQRQAPNTYQPTRPAPSTPGRAETSEETFDPAANEVEVSEEKAPKPLIQDEGEIGEMDLEFAKEKEAARVSDPTQGGIENHKFTILTRFDTSTINGPISENQYFIIHLDKQLTVEEGTILNPLTYNGNEITKTPDYDKTTNTIKYQLKAPITKNIQVPVRVDVDYNTKNMNLNAKTHEIVNSVSGLGVVDPKPLPPVVVDSNGNMLSTIIEEGRDDVVQIFDHGKNYRVNVDAYGTPVLKDWKMVGIRWNVSVTSDTELTSLGYKSNFTTVEGSGLGEIQDLKVNGIPLTKETGLETNDDIKGKLGITDSVHHDLKEQANTLRYSFYTKVTNKQAAYMLDLSAVLTDRKKVGAVRLVLPKGFSEDQIAESTPTRVGMNNRTTVKGEFLSNKQGQWTVTDAVCTGDDEGQNANKGLPLETRTLKGKQDFASGDMAVYKLDPTTGRMVVAEQKKSINSIPGKEADPNEAQKTGTLAVYKWQTNLRDSNEPNDYGLSNGVFISKYHDLDVRQEWNLVGDATMPKQTIRVKDESGKELASKELEKGNAGENKREFIIPGVLRWRIDGPGKATLVDHKVDQGLPTNNPDYDYWENLNTCEKIDGEQFHHLHNTAIKRETFKRGTFKVVKIDSKDSSKKLAGATYKLSGAYLEATTDKNGEITFSNIKPGTYGLVETKAPLGYKLDKEDKTVIVSKDGRVSVNGSNATLSGGGKSQIVHHSDYPNWPDYMNSIHYGKVDSNGNLTFYLYLKPEANSRGSKTDKDTHLNISIPGVPLYDRNVNVYNVNPKTQRATIRSAMENRALTQENIKQLGGSVLGAKHNNKITGIANQTDTYTEKPGYRINFPKERFEYAPDGWGFLVEVKTNINGQNSVDLSYDWLTDEYTESNSKIQQVVNLAKGQGDDNAVITITNEEYDRKPVAVTKVDENKHPLADADFVLKDDKDNIITNVITGANGVADFGKQPPGNYTIEEAQAPNKYIKSKVVFDVKVEEDGTVTYKARFNNGIGEPVPGADFILENEEQHDQNKPIVTNVEEHWLKVQENEPGDIGVKDGVWEAYRYESLKYHTKIKVSSSQPGERFSIQFDPNLDFKQYVNEMPVLKNELKQVIAEPYFDYSTNRLTYVFNEKSQGGESVFTLDIRGIIPSKYYAKQNGEYPFTITVAPGKDNITGEREIYPKIKADYGRYDTSSSTPAQSYYFRDVYTGDDGQEYFTVLAYYNPLADKNRSPRTLSFNWMSTPYGGGTKNIHEWTGNGTPPAFTLQGVKIYRAPADRYDIPDGNDKIPVNRYMPMSFGVRPEQDTSTYELVYNRRIDGGKVSDSANGFTLEYDKDKIQRTGAVSQNKPLKIGMPQISRNNEGYIIEQKFRVTNKENWLNLFRTFYMTNGSLKSSFASKVNQNKALVDQTSQEIPKYYSQVVKLINRKYVPGKFSIKKVSEIDSEIPIPNVTFALTDAGGNTIYRTTDINGNLTFDDLAPGNYTLVEHKPADKYIKSNKVWQVSVVDTGRVTVTELSLGTSGEVFVGDPLILTITNKPSGGKFLVYKKDGNGEGLQGATFTLTNTKDKTTYTRTSNKNGVVNFGDIPNGTYRLEETKAPEGYKELGKKWVVVVENNKAKAYNYVEGTGTDTQILKDSLLAGTHWVDVAHRPLTGWDLNENRWQGWVGNSPVPYKMGTRIIGINKDEKYVIQRYIINPEGVKLLKDKTKVEIHREKPEYTNMDWHDNSLTSREDFRVYKLNKPVTGNVEDFRLSDYGAQPMTKDVDFTTGATEKKPEPKRQKFGFTKDIENPIVIDVKVPYKDENGGVGTGMDLWSNGKVYWKSDYYERVSDIVEGDKVNTGSDSTIIGSYISEGSLDVTNDKVKHSFKLKKVKEGDANTTIQGAKFTLTGPGSDTTTRTMTTDDKGIIAFDELEPGTYKLKETSPAPGYENPATEWTVTVNADGTATIKADAEGVADPLALAADSPAQGSSSAPNPVLMNAVSATYQMNKLDAGEIRLPDTQGNESAEKVASEGNASEAAPFADQISRTKQLDNFLTTFGVNGGLELGEENVPSPVRAGGWETIDQNRSEGFREGSDMANNNGAPVVTKMTEINKDDNQLKQSFIFSPYPSGKRTREIQIHREPEYDLRQDDIVQVSFYKVDGNTFETMGGKEPLNIRYNVKRKDGNGPYRIYASIGSSITGPILVEVTVKYDQNNGVGLGTNYNSNTGATYDNKSWLAHSYTSEDSINCKFDVNIQTDGNGTVTANKQNPVKKGEKVTLNVQPKNGYKLKSLTAGNQAIPVAGPYEFNMPDSDVTVTAVFEKDTPKPKPHNITVTKPTEGGTITADKQSAVVGEKVTLDVKPDANYKLKSLTAGNQAIPVAGPYEFIMPDSDVTVTAVFEKDTPQPKPHNITVTKPTEGGTITANKESAVAGEKITLTVEPTEGYKLKSLTAGGQEIPVAGPYEFTMPDSDVTVTATFEEDKQPSEGTKIEKDGYAQITNKPSGLNLKLLKRSYYGKKLEGGKFTLQKMKDDKFEEPLEGTTRLTTAADKDGNIVFTEAAGSGEPGTGEGAKPYLWTEGYYLLTETEAPSGYKKPAAPWKIKVVEENGRLVARYLGPQYTTAGFINSEHSEVSVTGNTNGIETKSRLTFIDPTSTTTKLGTVAGAYDPEQLSQVGTFAQRLYVKVPENIGDTKKDMVNVQIVPKYKREELDIPGVSPVVIKQGVKTAYYTVYKLDKEPANIDEAITDYDLSKPGINMVKTARWRPFDWGFDEDQLNLEKGGVYFIDVEGFYDKAMITGKDEKGQPLKDKNGQPISEEDKEKIALDFEFYDGKRDFYQVVKKEDGRYEYETFKGASYQGGNIARGLTGEEGKGDTKADPSDKYAQWLGKKNGLIWPEITNTNPIAKAETVADIGPLYTSETAKEIPQEGLTLTNEEQTYNITFSKHGKDGEGKEWADKGELVAKNRLEGAVFKLQEKVGENYVDIPGSYVASAFNGYFGFRGLKPGRYRLMEVKAPDGYRPIDGAILTMTIAHIGAKVDGETGEITPERGQITLEYDDANGIVQYVKKDGKVEGGKLIDFVTSGTARNMGKIVNRKPGKGKVKIVKVDENGKALTRGEKEAGTKFKLSPLGTGNGDGEGQSSIFGTIGTDGTYTFENLPIGNYRLEEALPKPGYMNAGQTWQFTVGGKSLDPYAGDTNTPTHDISDKIIMEKPVITVQKPMNNDKTDVKAAIYPHKAQYLSMKSSFKLAPGTEIKPGDYFTLKLTDSIDLEGIYKNRSLGNLDIFADGVGTVAKGKYDKETGIITYTFTNYAKTYKLNTFKTELSAWINLEKIKTSTNGVEVGVGVGQNEPDGSKLNVNYDIPSETSTWPRYPYTYNYNLTGKMYELDPNEGEFVQYYYINRNHTDGKHSPTFYFTPGVNLASADITILRLRNNSEYYIGQSMPESFALNPYDPNLAPVYSGTYTDLGPNDPFFYKFGYTYYGWYYSGMSSKDSYIVKIKGKVKDEELYKEDKEGKKEKKAISFKNTADMWQGGTLWTQRNDWAYFMENTTEATAELEIVATNPINRIRLKKVDEKGNPLAGAEFKITMKKGDKYEAFGRGNQTSKVFEDEDNKKNSGIVEFSKLPAGEYRIEEVTAPKPYTKIDGPIIDLKVDDSGKIFEKVKNKDNIDVLKEVTGDIPINVVNHKPIDFIKQDKVDGKGLEGAEFKLLYKAKERGTYDDFDYKENGKPKTITSVEGGKFSLSLSKPGYYALEETKAPAGYIKPMGHVKEFAILDGKIKTKETALEAFVEKDPDTSTDTRESLLYGGVTPYPTAQGVEKNLDMYYLINPDNAEKTYSKDDSFTVAYASDNIVSAGNSIEVYGFDKDQKKFDWKNPTTIEGKSGENGKLVTFSLYDAIVKAEGKEDTGSVTSSKRWVVKIVAKDKGRNEENVIRTELKRGKDTYTARYSFKTADRYGAITDKFANLQGNLQEGRTQTKVIYVDYKEDNPVPIRIDNTKGTYPFTGGFGPNRWIVIIGAIIAAIAAEEYIRRKRSSAEPKGGV